MATVNLSGMGRTIPAGSLNQYRNQILANVIGQDDSFNASQIAGTIADQQRQEQDTQGTSAQFQKFLQGMGMMSANRGVNKALMTPAMQNGIMPYDKKLFGVAPKQPVPYQKVILDRQNLGAVLKGYQEVRSSMGGPVQTDTANMIANVKRSDQMIASALLKPTSNSIFEGVPKQPATNLYNIGIKNQRENSIYALV